MKENNSTAFKKSRLTTNAVIAIFMTVIIGLAIWHLPRGYSVDLSQIGKGKNVAVQVHDHNLVNSTYLMENLSKVRGEYEGVIEFVVADVNIAEGRAFAQMHKADPATLLFFAPDGKHLGSVQGVQTPDALKNILNRAFNLETRISSENSTKNNTNLKFTSLLAAVMLYTPNHVPEKTNRYRG